MQGQRTQKNYLLLLCEKKTLLSDKFGYQAKEICKRSVEGIAWFLFVAYSKNMRGEKLKEKQNE